MARLYIKEKKYSEAVSLLYEARDKLPQMERDEQYELRKNLGWARLMQELYSDAKTQLETAIQIDDTRASAHCLLAQVWERKGNPNKARQEWESCFASANSRSPDEDVWYGMARKRLFPKGKQ